MTNKDIAIIASILKNFRNYLTSKRITNQAILNYLLDEFSYKLEDENKSFNEKQFRKFINN